MDNLTHTLLGVTLSRAGFNRLAPQAGWLMVLSANLPDIDIVASAGGSLCYLDQHRGWTHSAVCAPLLAFAPLLVWWLLARRRKPDRRAWLGAYVVSLAGVTSHFLLDWLNVYGIRLLAPFQATWYRLDWVHIIDIWIWALLLVGVLAPLLAKLVYSEIGAKGGSGRAGAWVVLALFCAYIGARAMAHDRAVATMEARLYQGETPKRVAAVPGPASLFRWRGLVETERAWRVVDVDLWREFDPEAGRIFYKSPQIELENALKRTQTGRIYLDFAQFPVYRIVPRSRPEGGVEVSIADLRFGLPEDGAFTASFVLEDDLRVVRESFGFGTLKTGKP